MNWSDSVGMHNMSVSEDASNLIEAISGSFFRDGVLVARFNWIQTRP